MKIQTLKLKNFSKYVDVEVSFDQNTTYLIGKNGAGKSTIGLDGIWFMFQGIAEKASGGNFPLIAERFRFIGPNAPVSTGEMILFDEKRNIKIKVIRKLTKSGSELKFEGPEGIELSQQWLNDLFNVFLISPKKFLELSGTEQAKQLGIDTSEIDLRLKKIKEEYTFLNRELKQYDGLTESELVQRVDIYELNEKKNKILLFNKEQDDKKVENVRIMGVINQRKETLLDIERQIAQLEEKKAELHQKIQSDITAFESLPAIEEKKSTEEIDLIINQAGATNEKANQYDIFLKNKEAKEKKEAELKDNKGKQTKIEEERLEFIRSKKLPFKNLTIDEEGQLLLAGKPIKEAYFSTGELIKLIPILLSSQNPDLKYIFLQDFNLLDEENQNEVEKFLTDKGFQLVIEYIGISPIQDKNCILLKENQIVSDTEDVRESINL